MVVDALVDESAPRRVQLQGIAPDAELEAASTHDALLQEGRICD
jgi:hypothetical protein